MSTGILFHCVNGIGLGHLSRMLEVAKYLQQLATEPRIMFITSAEEHSWLMDQHIPYLYVPSEARNRYTWRIADEEIGQDQRRKSVPDGVNDAILNVVMEHFAPKTVVFDTYFSTQSIAACAQYGATPVAFFDGCGLTESHASAVQMVWRAGGHVVFAMDRDQPWPFRDTPRMHRVGRIVRQVEHAGAPSGEADSAAMGKRSLHVVCTQGGGGKTAANSAYYRTHPLFLEVVVPALARVRNEGVEFSVTVVLGPYGTWPVSVEVPDWIMVRKYEPQLLRLLLGADLLLAPAGYNTVSDAIATGCPSIFLPILEPTEDQRVHVESVVQQGAAFALPHEIELVATTVSRLLRDDDSRARMRRKMNRLRGVSKGAAEAATVLEFISEQTMMRDGSA